MATLLQKALPVLAQPFAIGRTSKVPRGSLGSYIVGAPPEYGQPRPDAGGSSVASLISPERMREIVMRTPTAAACLNAILDFSSAVEIKLRNVDPSQPANPARLADIKDYLTRPNPQDTWLQFKLALFRDIVTMGWAAVEIEKDADGNVANLWTLDAAKLYIDFDEQGVILGYDMLDARGMPIHGPDGTHAWDPDEIIFYRLNPVTYSRYPASRIYQLFSLGLIEDMMMSFIGGKFTESNVPFGMLDLGDVSPKELDSAINYWNAQVKKNHRIVVTGSKGGSKYYQFGYHLKDLEATNLLGTLRGQIMGIMGVTANELGESQDINKSNGYNLSFTFKKRAVEPLLNEFCCTTTKRFIYERKGYRDIELYYDEIDSRDELLQAQIDDTQLKNGTTTINEVRNRKGKPNIDGGDLPNIETSTGAIPVSMVEEFAQAQLDGLKAAVAETLTAIAQAQAQSQQAVDADGNPTGPTKLPSLIDLPLIRPPLPPDSGHTPLGSGRSGMKIKYPSPQQLGGNKANSPQQKPRGPVQAAQNAGVHRKDNY